MDHIKEEQEEDPELLLYDLSVIAFCTDNFLDKNKLGEGGFGSVFKHCWKSPCLCNWKRTKLPWHESMSMNLNGTEVLDFGLVLWWKHKHNQKPFFDDKGFAFLLFFFSTSSIFISITLLCAWFCLIIGVKVEAEEQPEISEAYSVSAVPFFVFFKIICTFFSLE
ncbi:hypothetical protein AHAS_Ahas14G0123700 [Arachis hypogaea]